MQVWTIIGIVVRVQLDVQEQHRRHLALQEHWHHIPSVPLALSQVHA